MKRIFYIALFATSLTACSSDSGSKSNGETDKVEDLMKKDKERTDSMEKVLKKQIEESK